MKKLYSFTVIVLGLVVSGIAQAGISQSEFVTLVTRSAQGYKACLLTIVEYASGQGSGLQKVTAGMSCDGQTVFKRADTEINDLLDAQLVGNFMTAITASLLSAPMTPGTCTVGGPTMTDADGNSVAVVYCWYYGKQMPGVVGVPPQPAP